jgi:hypothetical protein
MLTLLENIKRNELLFYFGCLAMLGGVICSILMALTSVQVAGVNAYLKPMKFFFSVALFAWTMAHYMQYLTEQKQVAIYSWMCVIGLAFELFAITLQASQGKLSHFNVSSAFDSALFSAMGIVISIVMLHTAYIGYLFFQQKEFVITMELVWAIRLGIIITVVFAFEGGMMGAQLRHTVGAPDGGAGLPVLNWSKHHGDLRVAHFLGIHALQIIPLFAALFAKNIQQVIFTSALYFVLVSLTLIQALRGKAFVSFRFLN